MGLIKRNAFWFRYHDIYVEPTEEQKIINEERRIQSKRKARQSLRTLGMMTGVMANMSSNNYLSEDISSQLKSYSNSMLRL